jgi:hypothetical protein
MVTSFMPRRIEAQRAALQSLRVVGLSMISVNSRSEVADAPLAAGGAGFALTSARMPYFATTVHSRQAPVQVEQRL